MRVQLSMIATLSEHDQEALRGMAIAALPYEACGLVHQHNIIHQYTNVFSGDKTRGFDFEFDPNDPTIKAIWHSHPKGMEQPSHDDIPCIQLLLEHGFQFNHIIVTPRRVIEYKAELIDIPTTAA